VQNQKVLDGNRSNQELQRFGEKPRIYYSAYSPEYLTANAERLARDAAAETWCIFDNTAAFAAIGDALTTRDMVPGLR
jgi:uncharacterized protein YecE (DUF72 family)